MTGWRIAAARRTGEAHARRGERGQDALRVAAAGPVLILAAADGAGGARRGGAGAALAVRAAVAAARSTLAEASDLPALPDAAILGWADAARARIAQAAARRGLAARDGATTLALAVSDGAATLALHVGDGAIVARDAAGAWRALSWPAAGAHAGETDFLTDDPPALRLSRLAEPVTALALLTDGLERLVLDFAARAPHGPFFERMTAPLRAPGPPGRDARLSRALGAWLGGAGVAARTDDDRTLVLAARA